MTPKLHHSDPDLPSSLGLPGKNAVVELQKSLYELWSVYLIYDQDSGQLIISDAGGRPDVLPALTCCSEIPRYV